MLTTIGLQWRLCCCCKTNETKRWVNQKEEVLHIFQTQEKNKMQDMDPHVIMHAKSLRNKVQVWLNPILE